MLNSASDYKFVNVTPVADRIHGNILPITNPLNAPAPVYFENYLYILEGYYERMNPESAGLNTIAVPPRTLIAGDIYALNLNSYTLSVSNGAIRGPQLGYDNDVAAYISPDTTFPNNHINIGYTQDSTYYIYNFLQNWYNPCVEYKSPYYQMRPAPYYTPSRLLGEFIRCKFYEYNHMTKLLFSMRLGDIATKIVHQTLKPDGSVDSENEIGLRNTAMSYVRSYSSTSDGHGGTITYQLSKTVATYKQAFFTFPYATNATLIWKCSVAASSSSSQSETAYVWGTRSLTVSNGAIQVPTNMFDSIADDACNISGRPSTSTISWYNGYLVIDFNFPATMSGTSWSWQPTYT